MDDIANATERVQSKLKYNGLQKRRTLLETLDFELFTHISDHWCELSEYLLEKDPEHRGKLPIFVWHEALYSIMPYLYPEVLERVDAKFGGPFVGEVDYREALKLMQTGHSGQFGGKHWHSKMLVNVCEAIMKADLSLESLSLFFDRNHDGHVSLGEVIQVLLNLKLGISKFDIVELAHQLHPDRENIKIDDFLLRLHRINSHYKASMHLNLTSEWVRESVKVLREHFSQMGNLISVFTSIDENADGLLQFDEMTSYLHSIPGLTTEIVAATQSCGKTSDDIIKELVMEFDQSGDGTINCLEFLEAVDSGSKLNSEGLETLVSATALTTLYSHRDILRRACEYVDSDHRGILSPMEFRMAMDLFNKAVGDTPPFSEAVIDAFVFAVGYGEVDYYTLVNDF